MNAININIGDQVEYIGKIKENPFWDLSTPFYVKRVFDDEVHLVDQMCDLGCFPVAHKDIRKIEDKS